MSESSSASENERPSQCYNACIDQLLQDRVSRKEPFPCRPNGAYGQSLDKDDMSGEENQSSLDSSDEEVQSNSSEVMSERDENNRVILSDERRGSTRSPVECPSPKVRSKRRIKPVVKLTYDKSGKSKDHPITIVDRGIIIKVG